MKEKSPKKQMKVVLPDKEILEKCVRLLEDDTGECKTHFKEVIELLEQETKDIKNPSELN